MNESCRIAGSRFRPYASSTPEGDREQDRRFGLLCFGACPIANQRPPDKGEAEQGSETAARLAAAEYPGGGRPVAAERAAKAAQGERVGGSWRNSLEKYPNDRGPADQCLVSRAPWI